MALRCVVLPQAIRVVLPPIGNFSISLLKDTAVVSAVAAPEIMFRARNLMNETYLSPQIYTLAALIYLAMSLPLSRLVRRLELRMGRGEARCRAGGACGGCSRRGCQSSGGGGRNAAHDRLGVRCGRRCGAALGLRPPLPPPPTLGLRGGLH